jgi:hypothetical protein
MNSDKDGIRELAICLVLAIFLAALALLFLLVFALP